MKNILAISTLLVNTAILYILGNFYVETRPPTAEVEEISGFETRPSTAEVDITSEGKEDEIEIARQELLEKISESGLTNLRDVIKDGNSIINNENATVEQLKDIARRTNASSNYLDLIVKEYNSYYSDNYRYEFVQKKIDPSRNAYVKVSNDLRSIRNRAYYRLGTILEEEGRIAEAFFYYNDAFRLSVFDAYKKDEPGMRYLAEQKMKSILGLGDIKSYTTWQ